MNAHLTLRAVRPMLLKAGLSMQPHRPQRLTELGKAVAFSQPSNAPYLAFDSRAGRVVHAHRLPCLVLNFCIALGGALPPRN